MSEPLKERSERQAGVTEAPQGDELASAVAREIAAVRCGYGGWSFV